MGHIMHDKKNTLPVNLKEEEQEETKPVDSSLR